MESNPYYQENLAATTWCHDSNKQRGYGSSNTRLLQLGDKVKMVLNCKEKTLTYFHQNKSLGIAFRDIDFSVKYRFVVCISGHHSVEIIKFKFVAIK